MLGPLFNNQDILSKIAIIFNRIYNGDKRPMPLPADEITIGIQLSGEITNPVSDDITSYNFIISNNFIVRVRDGLLVTDVYNKAICIILSCIHKALSYCEIHRINNQEDIMNNIMISYYYILFFTLNIYCNVL